MDFKVLTETVTNDANIYASGDQIGELMTLTDALIDSHRGVIRSLSIVDKAKQKSALSVLFFRAEPTVASADNAALDISDSELAAKFVGMVNVAAADYKDLSNGSVATVQNLSLAVESDTDELYAVVLSGGTPTYGAVDQLELKIGIERGK